MLEACATESGHRPLLQVTLAETELDVRAAQRLRFEVFSRELGAHLPDRWRALDADGFDDYCDHLLVRNRQTDEIVGTYRMLPPARAAAAGRYYAETEFDLGGLAELRPRMVEIGRACVHPDYRHGGVLALLWSGMLRYLVAHSFAYVIGCASVPVRDGGEEAVTVCRTLLRNHLAPARWRVAPRSPFALRGFGAVPDAEPPPLIKGYLRLGAQVCGPPAWDAEFNTADVLMILSRAHVNGRYVERFSRAG